MEAALRALIVEDRADDVDLMLHELSRAGYAVERWAVDSEAAYVGALEAGPDVVLCDYSMVQFNAMRALALLQAKGCDTPFIVVTGSISEEVAVECMKQGAADYVIKDRLARLGPAVRQALKAKAARDAQRRAEAALRVSEDRFERAVRAAHVGTWDWDLQSGKMVWSEGHAEMFGLRFEEFDGRYETFVRQIHPDDVARINAAVATARAGRTLYDEEYRVIWPNGTQRWVHGTGRFAYNAAGQPIRMAGVVQDVTERRRAEEAVREKDAQLRQAQKMEAIGALASGIAHDVNNLLTVIYGSVDAARQIAPNDVNLTEPLDRIEEAAQQAAGVTKGLLAFARQTPPEKKTVDVCAAVDRATRFLKRMLSASVELTVEKPENDPIWVSADETHLQQALLNLAINARDAMPDGGSLRIRVARVGAAAAGSGVASTDQAAGCAQLQVIDTGTGMSPELIEKIFDPFFTTKPRGQGTGLGLAITQSIVKEHGGQLTVESAPGKGTTFTLTLPCIVREVEPRNGVVATLAACGNGELILVVEDYQPVREVIVGALRARGYEVLQATAGDAALRGFEENNGRIQAMILDLDLPKKSGPDVLREIRARGCGTPVIVVTGKADADLEQVLDARSTLLCKPFRLSDLLALLSQQLRARRASETSA